MLLCMIQEDRKAGKNYQEREQKEKREKKINSKPMRRKRVIYEGKNKGSTRKRKK